MQVGDRLLVERTQLLLKTLQAARSESVFDTAQRQVSLVRPALRPNPKRFEQRLQPIDPARESSGRLTDAHPHNPRARRVGKCTGPGDL
jgi:hypothetical protein